MRSLAILIPNYNGAAFIAETVGRFSLGFPGVLVTVVDDASTDDSVAILSETPARLVARQKNGGFAAAVNSGLEILATAGFDDVLVANSDVVADQTVCAMIASALAAPGLDPKTAVFGFLEETATNGAAHQGDKISGFLFALRTEVLATVGYFDERFYMYGEEQDYFRRVTEAGFLIHQTEIRVKHLSEGSGGSKLRNSWLAIRNSIYLEAKRRAFRNILRKAGALFLIINRLYRPKSTNDPSLRRVLRPGILVGNIFLLMAIFWNAGMMLKATTHDNKSKPRSKA